MKYFSIIDPTIDEDYLISSNDEEAIIYFKSFQTLNDIYSGTIKLNFKEAYASTYNAKEEDNLQILENVVLTGKFRPLVRRRPIIVLHPNEVKDDALKLSFKTKNLIYDVRTMEPTEVITYLTQTYTPDNALFNDRYNQIKDVSKQELLETYKTIQETAQKIKDKKLSPAEAVYYIFDQVRSRMYVMEDKSLDASLSRDLTQILKSDYLVCSGYANLFVSICNFLGIKAENVYWNKNDANRGHVSVFVYINDEKYNIHGVYAFEPTWASKKGEDDQSYLNNASLAFMPIFYELEYKKLNGFSFRPDINNNYTKLIERIERFQKLIKLQAPPQILDNEGSLIIELIEFIDTLTGTKRNPIKHPSLSAFKLALSEIEGFNNILPVDTFVNIVSTVRSLDEPINEEDLLKLENSSISKKLKQSRDERAKRLLRSLFGE